MREIRAKTLSAFSRYQPDGPDDDFRILTMSSLVMAFDNTFPWAPLRPTTKEIKYE